MLVRAAQYDTFGGGLEIGDWSRRESRSYNVAGYDCMVEQDARCKMERRRRRRRSGSEVAMMGRCRVKDVTYGLAWMSGSASHSARAGGRGERERVGQLTK